MKRHSKNLENHMEEILLIANLIRDLICEKGPAIFREFDCRFLSNQHASQRREKLYEPYSQANKNDLPDLIKQSSDQLARAADEFRGKSNKYQEGKKDNQHALALFKLGYELLLDCLLLHDLAPEVKKVQEKAFRDDLNVATSKKGKVILGSIRGAHKVLTTIKRHKGFHALSFAAESACGTAQLQLTFSDLLRDLITINQIQHEELNEKQKLFLENYNQFLKSNSHKIVHLHSKSKIEMLTDEAPDNLPKPKKISCFSFFFCCCQPKAEEPTEQSLLLK